MAARSGSCMRSTRERVHVLAVPFAGLVGHMNPLMGLCQELAAEGAAVTFAYSQAYYERAQADSILEKSRLDVKEKIRMVGVSDGLAFQECLSPESPRLQAQATIDMEDSLLQLAQTTLHPSPITCIIADAFIACAPSVARRLGIPHVAFWTQSAASFAAHVVTTQNYSSLKEHDAAAAEGDGPFPRLITCIPGCPPLKFKELPTFLQSCDPSNFLFSFLTKCFKDMEESPNVLVNTYHELECESMDFINKRHNVSAIGPILPRDFLTELNSSKLMGRSESRTVAVIEDHECLTWLDMQKPRSVLFVSFGSLALMSETQIAELAAGLENSGCPFLMVAREAMMDGQAERFPTGFQKRLSDNGKALFVTWAPQLQVLAHGSIGGFLSHCGWNSTLEGLCKGLPFLCWPVFIDQMLNCRCIVDAWGIGIDLENESELSTFSTNVPLVHSNVIADKVRYLMDPVSSATMRQRAKQLGMAALKAVLQDDGSSHHNLKSFKSWLYQEVA